MTHHRIHQGGRVRGRRGRTASILLAVLLVLGSASAGTAAIGTGRLIVTAAGAPAGATGTPTDPVGSIGAALAMARPGDTVVLGGGEYVEDVVIDAADASADLPVVVRAADGEVPVLRGRLWLTSPSHWHVSGLEVTWRDGLLSTQHLVKVTDGVGWSLSGFEIHGARSYAGLLVTGSDSRPTEPSGWSVTGSCIHDTIPSNDVNQDHLIYANTGLGAGPGEIRGNVLFTAPNGNAVKLAGPSPDVGGTAQVTVADNVIAGTGQGVLIGGSSHGNVVEGNTFGPFVSPYTAVRSFQLDNNTNVARANVGHGGSSLFLHYSSPGGQVQDGGGNSLLDAALWTSTPTCDQVLGRTSVEPVPSEPVPSEPVPSEPVPSEPVPSEPEVSEPVPSEPVPSEPVLSEPVLSDPLPALPSIVVEAIGLKIKGRHQVDLAWQGAGTSTVEVRRNGDLVAMTSNDGSHTDWIGGRGGATYVYVVCEPGGASCSLPVAVTF